MVYVHSVLKFVWTRFIWTGLVKEVRGVSHKQLPQLKVDSYMEWVLFLWPIYL